MPKYQIEFKKVNGGSKNWSYEYFDAKKNIEEAACAKANEKLFKDKENNSFARSVGLFKPVKVLTVREWDTEKKQVKRGGHRFKLHLSFLELTSQSGRKERDEWYQYNG